MTTERHRCTRRARQLHADAAGQMTVDWALVLAAVALPMYFVCAICLKLLVSQYQMVTFLQALPFP